MSREIFENALKSTIPESAFLTKEVANIRGRPHIESNKEGYKATLDSGTTVLAFHFKDGIMLAGDKQMSSWHSILSQESIKINEVSPYSAFMFAGSVGDGQAVVNGLRVVSRDFISRFRMPLSLDGQANYVSRFLRMHYNYGVFLEAWGILAGFNFSPPEFKIYSVEPTGSKISCDFATTGSGGERADAELEQFRGIIKVRTLNAEEAMQLAVRAIYAAGKKDMGTSDVRLALPLIATVTLREGFRFVDPKKVEEVRNKLIDKERSRGNVS